MLQHNPNRNKQQHNVWFKYFLPQPMSNQVGHSIYSRHDTHQRSMYKTAVINKQKRNHFFKAVWIFNAVEWLLKCQIKSKFSSYLLCYAKACNEFALPISPLLRLATYHFRRNIAAMASTVCNTVHRNWPTLDFNLRSLAPVANTLTLGQMAAIIKIC